MRAATTIVARVNRVERLKSETFKFLSQCLASSIIDAWSVRESSDTESKETLSLCRKKVTSNAASHVEDGPTPARRTPIQWRHAS